MFCKANQQPTIYYKFANSDEKSYKSIKSPIQIAIQEGVLETFTGAQCPEWYGFIFYNSSGQVQYSNNAGQGALGPITFCRKIQGARYGDNSVFDKYWYFQVGCRGGDDIGYANGIGEYWLNYAVYGEPHFIGFQIYDPRGERRNLVDNCGNPKKNCELIVKYNDQTIFTDRGNCPITYRVQCEDCPEGTTKIETAGFPGYCCVDCASLKSEIRSVTQIIRSKTSG